MMRPDRMSVQHHPKTKHAVGNISVWREIDPGTIQQSTRTINLIYDLVIYGLVVD